MKDRVNTMSELEDRIKELKAVEGRQMAALKLQAIYTAESMRPSNLVKSAFNEMAGSKSLKRSVLGASVGIGAGMLIKKLVTYKSKGLIGTLAGFALQAVTTGLIAKKLPVLKQKIATL